MAKTKYFAPILLAANWGGEGDETGGGSSGSSPDATMCTYTEWLEMYKEDLDGDGTIDEYDFAWWWDDNGFTEEDWDTYNPDIDWPF